MIIIILNILGSIGIAVVMVVVTIIIVVIIIIISNFMTTSLSGSSLYWSDGHRLPDGVGTNGVFTEVPQIPYSLL